MGSGEPLENFDNIVRFLNIINDERGQNISMRKITLSTSGIVPNIYKLADENIPITLAISLHASTQEKREQIMPIARKYKLPEILKACDYYVKTTGRDVYKRQVDIWEPLNFYHRIAIIYQS